MQGSAGQPVGRISSAVCAEPFGLTPPPLCGMRFISFPSLSAAHSSLLPSPTHPLHSTLGMRLTRSIVALAMTASSASASLRPVLLPRQPDVTVNFDSRTFTNKGLVGFVSDGRGARVQNAILSLHSTQGRIPHDAMDRFGETLGALGVSFSSAAFTRLPLTLTHHRVVCHRSQELHQDRRWQVQQPDRATA